LKNGKKNLKMEFNVGKIYYYYQIKKLRGWREMLLGQNIMPYRTYLELLKNDTVVLMVLVGTSKTSGSVYKCVYVKDLNDTGL